MPSQRIGANLLQLRWNVPEQRVGDFESWYDREHLGDMVAVPGIHGGRRFARVPMGFSNESEFGHLTLYQLADLSPLSSQEFQKLVEEPSPWTRQVAFDLEMARRVYRQIWPEPVPDLPEQPAGSALLHVMMRAEPSVEEDFNHWYEQEHLPALLAVPGILSARRFRAVDDGADFGGHAAQQGFDFLAVYELSGVEVMETDAFRTAGSPTPWRKRLGDAVGAHVQVYRLVFPTEGAMEKEAW